MSADMILAGADRIFGAEIRIELGAAGLSVAEGSEAQPIRALVINSPVAIDETRFDAIDDVAFALAVEEGVLAVFDIVQAHLGRLERGGRIVVVASRAHLGGWGGAHKMAAGAALIGFCRTLALELIDQGIAVNVVAPDFIDAYRDAPAARKKVAKAVAWFASEESDGVSGEVLLVDDGRALQMREARRRD